MKIIVCIKQVPNTNEVRLNQETGTLMREGVPSIINPDDLAGIEAALLIKDNVGAHVSVMTMGPPQADIALREALAMGCDEAYLISDRAFAGADTWATSSTLAGAAKLLGFDLIITGRQAIDGDTAQVGPQMAEHLRIPVISYAEEINATRDNITVKRQYEDRYQRIQANYPLLITALSELNEPRYMSVGGVVNAYEKEIRTLTYEDLKAYVSQENIGLKGSPTRVKKSFTKQPKGKGELHQVSDDESVSIIIQKLKEHHIL
ncbi:MAG: electron transfer flavoprotein subunit beta/FixA family protein [Defluviitaleaceae bacterium]|nr:electron transfer flavoprotein subunit beta/FixA family protein [Defluviitaleaceae bacterium]MCL2273882.1 electron transfer flavoprotein subunit beta/FixA family protein [Defluviitaleaceae bacterium]